MKIERSTWETAGWEMFGGLSQSLVAVCIVLLLGSSSARAQGLFASGTPTPTPIQGGAAAIGAPTAMSTKGAGSPGVVQHPQQIILHVGGQDIFPDNRTCAEAIGQALETHAPVATSDQKCVAEMTRALDIQKTTPEPTGWATP